MKNLKTLLLIAIVTLSFNTIQAQTKVAHIDINALIEAMPETKVMSTEMEKLGKTYQDEITKAQEDLKTKIAKYTAEGPTQTEEENTRRMGEIQQEEQKIYQGQQIAQRALSEKSNEKLNPIVTKAQKAIAAVAKANGFDYVLDKSTLLVAEGTDILDLVKKNLGI